MDNQTPPVPPTPDPQTPPPTPDEEWAKRLKLDFDPERIKDTPPSPEQPQQNNNGQPQNNWNQAPQNNWNQQPNQYPPLQSEGEQMPPTYMVWSVLALVLCCFPPAIVAIIYSAQVSSKFYAKDYEGARKCSERAQIWIIVSIVLGIISMALYLPLTLLSS